MTKTNPKINSVTRYGDRIILWLDAIPYCDEGQIAVDEQGNKAIVISKNTQDPQVITIDPMESPFDLSMIFHPGGTIRFDEKAAKANVDYTYTKYNYKIHIGEIFDLIANENRPKQTIYITDEQFEVITMFANTKKDADLNTVYIINDCEFKVIPHISLEGLIPEI
jgi:hypothetical protein